MNKLELTRGVGLSRQKFNFFQDGIREGFKAILSGLGLTEGEGVKLHGCAHTVTDDAGVLTIEITEGYIALAGEAYYVPAQTIEKQPGEVCYFQVDSEKVDNIPGQIKGGGTFDMQEQRRAKLVVSTTIPGSYMPYNARTFETAVRNSAFDIGFIQFFDPRPQGKVMTDFFDMGTGIGLPEEKYKGWVVLGIHADYKDEYAGRVLMSMTDTATDPDFDAVGKKGGEKAHALTVAELPAHEFLIANPGSGGTATNRIGTGAGEYILGLGESHNNLPPYIVAAAIMRVA